MNSVEQLLDDQIEKEIRILPQYLKLQVLDFVGYLKNKYTSQATEDSEEKLLETFGSWKDDRKTDDIIQEIYNSRTISELRSTL
jgi:hypothetical protein